MSKVIRTREKIILDDLRVVKFPERLINSELIRELAECVIELEEEGVENPHIVLMERISQNLNKI